MMISVACPGWLNGWATLALNVLQTWTAFLLPSTVRGESTFISATGNIRTALLTISPSVVLLAMRFVFRKAEYRWSIACGSQNVKR